MHSAELQTDALVMLLDALARTGTAPSEVEQVEQACTMCHALFNLCASLEWQLDGLVASQLVQVERD